MKNLFFILAVLCLDATVSAQIVILEPKREALPESSSTLQLRRLTVSVEIRDGVATTQVDHVFYNPFGRRSEGNFLFAMPDNAHLDSFSMWIGGRETPAELLDANKARAIYTEIVRRQIDPALLEYAGNGLLKARVFPIEPLSEKQVRLRYTQVLERDGQMLRYAWPLRACRIESTPIATVHFAVKVRTKTALKTCYSPSHTLELIRDSERSANAVFDAQGLVPDRNFELLLSSGKDTLGLDLLTQNNQDGHFFWLTLVPSLTQSEIVARDLVIAVDTSGSMAGTKIEQARRALKFCVDNLNPGDRFSLITFATEASTVERDWLANNAANRARAHAYVDGMKAMGGTNVEEALDLVAALPRNSERPCVLILLSDGKPTIGARDDDSLLARARTLNNIRIFPVGIGYEINTLLLDKLADNSNGWRTYVSPDEDLELKLSAHYQKLSSPILTQPKLWAKGITLLETHPKRMPDLFKGVPLHVFGRFQGSGPARLQLEGRVNGRKITLEYQVNFDATCKNNTFIPGLWAQRRVAYLLDQIRLNGEERELSEEIVRLARTYGIVTPYTSQLILEDDADSVAGADIRRRDKFKASQPASLAEEMSTANDGRRAAEISKTLQGISQSDTRQLAPPVPKDEEKTLIRCQIAAGHAFYLRLGVWVDSRLDYARINKQKTFQFASPAFFQWLEAHPEARPILALGNKVRFLHGDTIYTVEP